jgi:C-terminal processing protease CtpA/Prc
VIIVDIRANGGGSCELTKIWLYLLTGEIVPNNYLSVSYAAEPFEDTYDELFVQVLLHHFEGSTLEMHNNKWSDLVLEMIPMIPTLSRSARFGDFHSISDQMDRVVANDKLIILLINRADGSAAEQFTDLIMSMENTLVIGQNTSGTLVTGSMLVLYLPNSNIQVTMPMDFNLFDEAYFLEGIGIAPDVWVVGDSLKAALAILEKRGDS